MKPLILLLCCFFTALPAVIAGEAGSAWSNDYAAAVKTGRPVLLNFTGSDWCVWCHRLRDEVFQTAFFAQYAAESLALVELDFPRKKSLSPELKKQNDGLAQKFGVDSYPTIILLGPDGQELARLGYMQGGPKTFVRELKRRLAAGQKQGP
jgi:thioredoxin-related protein